MKSPQRPSVKIACVGEVMIELIANESDQAKIGVAGDTYNSAHYLNQILAPHSIETSYVTTLGDDSFSDRIAKKITASGIDTSLVDRRTGGMPGLYAIETDADGERSFAYWRSASAARTMFQEPCGVPLSELDKFDLVMLSGISMAILPPETRENLMHWLDAFRAKGGLFAYDSNHRPSLWENLDVARDTNAAMWRRTDIALPSIDDEMALFGDMSEGEVLARLKSYGVTRGALKRGEKGPLDLTSWAPLQQADTASKVVDSTAAGDSFNAGYLAACVLSKPSETALAWGHRLAAHVVTRRGAIVPISSDWFT